MLKIKAKRAERGQGLVEYALILALVALAAIIILGLSGGSIQRVYGQVVAMMGGKMQSGDVGTANHLIISKAECWVVNNPSQGQTLTGLWITGDTDIDISKLTGFTEGGLVTSLVINPASSGNPCPNGGGSCNEAQFSLNPQLGNTADASKCPRSVVIKSFDPEEIAVSPVNIINYP